MRFFVALLLRMTSTNMVSGWTLDSAILCKAVLSTGWIGAHGRGRECGSGAAEQTRKVLVTLWTHLFLEAPQLAAADLLLEV
jgi:hypothetical protein